MGVASWTSRLRSTNAAKKVFVGLGIAYAVTGVLGWAFLPSAPLILGATVFSAVLGIGFGFFPARRAARLNPIEALRFE